MELRSDSKTCKQFIEEGKRLEQDWGLDQVRARLRCCTRPLARGVTALCPAPPLQVVDYMDKQRFFFEHTAYPELREVCGCGGACGYAFLASALQLN